MITVRPQDSGILSTHPTADIYSQTTVNESLSVWAIPQLFFIIYLKFKFIWQSYISICKVYQLYKSRLSEHGTRHFYVLMSSG